MVIGTGMGGVLSLLGQDDVLEESGPRKVPATRNLDTLDPAIDLDVVTGGPRHGTWAAGIANSFGFGGHNVSLAFTSLGTGRA